MNKALLIADLEAALKILLSLPQSGKPYAIEAIERCLKQLKG